MKFLLSFVIFYTLAVSAHAAVYWTGWLDRDNPSGTGDWETYNSFKPRPCRAGYRPLGANCRVKHTYQPWYAANQNIALQCTSGGFVCKNSDNTQYCKDYEIQFRCYRR
ncbi:cartilage intermediate layer protein 2-like [Dendronephthya gigantea]|uniref:cartilage intermediate layer protein 2-like n=1 Tax=Dendronephthya gigantea TaxID=151771 RepID=UPI00106922C2|nr:cartilage intermediate layer protein 2-like [Dendronephthya gigantea]